VNKLMRLFMVADTETLWVVSAGHHNHAKKLVRKKHPLAGRLTATAIDKRGAILFDMPLCKGMRS